MKNANRKRNKKDAKANEKDPKRKGSLQKSQPSGRFKSPTKKKPIKDGRTKEKSGTTKRSNDKGKSPSGRIRQSSRNTKTTKKRATLSNSVQTKHPTKKKPQKVNSQKLTLEKTNTEILNDLKTKGRTFKSTARSLKISESNLRAYRKFYLGIKGGKKPPDDLRGKILKEAAKRKVDTKKEVKVFKGQITNRSIIHVPADRTLNKWANDKYFSETKKKEVNYKYAHAFIDIEYTYTDGTKSQKTVGQFFMLKDGSAKIQELLSKYIDTLVDYSYVQSVKLLNIGYYYV